MYRKIGLLLLVFILSVSTLVYAQENLKDKDSILRVTHDNDFKLMNLPDIASRNTDIKIMVLPKKEGMIPILNYRSAGEQSFKQVEMQPEAENSSLFIYIIPASDNHSDYIEVYFSDNNEKKNTSKTKTYIIQTLDMSISPLAGIEDPINNTSDSNGDVSINYDYSLIRYFNDVSANSGIFNGFNLNNFSDSIISPTGNGIWPSVNSKNNQMRTIGSVPHKGLDFAISANQPVYTMLDGYYYTHRTNLGINNYYATKYDLQKVDHKNSADVIFYYIHINPVDPAPTTTVSKGTKVGTVHPDDGARHLHVSIRDFNNFELPHYYFFKNISSLDYGYRTELIHPKDVVGKTVTFKGYVFTGTEPEEFSNVTITYQTENSGLKTATMSKSGYEYTYTFPSQYTGETVAFYVTAYRNGMPYDMKSFKPSYYNIYLSGSTFISTPPVWSATYSTYIQ